LKGDSKKFNIRVKFEDIQETRQDRRRVPDKIEYIEPEY